jgi:hypothetical protein
MKMSEFTFLLFQAIEGPQVTEITARRIDHMHIDMRCPWKLNQDPKRVCIL